MKIQEISEYLTGFQDRLCQELENFDGTKKFQQKNLETERSFSRPRVLADGDLIEKAAVNYTLSRGKSLPAAATNKRPELAGRPFEAVSTSWIIHPRNPYAPTTHGNLRAFISSSAEGKAIWWFGGGIDLTPFYGFMDDAKHWHTIAKNACDPFGKDVYSQCKQACDRYFYLPHRKEHRGIGGLFFDNWSKNGFEESFSFIKSIGDHFQPAYMPILKKRSAMQYGDSERRHQLYRRGRYVEFNLLYDRGTRYGLQSGHHIESILASMPPMVRFDYDYCPEDNSPEAVLSQEYLSPRDWLTECQS